MSNTEGKVSESVSFEEAINFTQSLLEQIEAEKLTETDIETAITSLVQSENGGRGFFVTYLTAESNISDHPTPAVISALASSQEIVSELLVKNLAMSTAMAVTHRRNDNEEMAMGSDKVRERTINLIKQLKGDVLTQKLQELQNSTATGKGIYQSFLQRWGYDHEQLQIIEETLKKVR